MSSVGRFFPIILISIAFFVAVGILLYNREGIKRGWRPYNDMNPKVPEGNTDNVYDLSCDDGVPGCFVSSTLPGRKKEE